MEKHTKIRKIIFWTIIIIAILARVIGWPEAIKEVNCDEIMTAVNAKSIADTGKDIYGTSFPVYLEAWHYTGQSTLLMYIMAIVIKLFGASIFTVRLPMLLISIISLFVVFDFARRIFKNKNIAYILLALLAITPWHIMQARWSIDCNMFSHFLLISIYLLYLGLRSQKRKWLYISMVFFGLTMYTYGLSIYVVPLFLLIMAIYLLRKKEISIKELVICMVVYLLVSTPILLMYVVNFFHLQDIHLGPITIQYFKETNRVGDMLFFIPNNHLQQLNSNVKYTLNTMFMQYDAFPWNAIYGYGTIYLISIVFFFIGIIELIRNKEQWDSVGKVMIALWLILSIALGLIVSQININRLNCIWYPMLFITAYGIYEFCKISSNKYVWAIIGIIYIGMFVGFTNEYYTRQIQSIETNRLWSNGLIRAAEYAKELGMPNIQMEKQINTSDNDRINLLYLQGFEQKEGIQFTMGNLETIQPNTVYIMEKGRVKEEWKDNVKKIFMNYVVITQ